MIIGLTGGIGSGKSAAGNIFRQHGITVIDADQASREVFEKDPIAKSDAIDLLGEEVVQSDGSLSREKIRDLVFNDYDLKSNLEKIVHPAVRKVISNEIQKSESILLSFNLISWRESPLTVSQIIKRSFLLSTKSLSTAFIFFTLILYIVELVSLDL